MRCSSVPSQPRKAGTDLPVPTAAPERPMTVADVAEFFGCNRETVKRRARSGALPAFKFGKSWYFRRSDIDRAIAVAVESGAAIGAAQLEE
jgi:excisionase family DNA binding protein